MYTPNQIGGKMTLIATLSLEVENQLNFRTYNGGDWYSYGDIDSLIQFPTLQFDMKGEAIREWEIEGAVIYENNPESNTELDKDVFVRKSWTAASGVKPVFYGDENVYSVVCIDVLRPLVMGRVAYRGIVHSENGEKLTTNWVKHYLPQDVEENRKGKEDPYLRGLDALVSLNGYKIAPFIRQPENDRSLKVEKKSIVIPGRSKPITISGGKTTLGTFTLEVRTPGFGTKMVENAVKSGETMAILHNHLKGGCEMVKCSLPLVEVVSVVGASKVLSKRLAAHEEIWKLELQNVDIPNPFRVHPEEINSFKISSDLKGQMGNTGMAYSDMISTENPGGNGGGSGKLYSTYAHLMYDAYTNGGRMWVTKENTRFSDAISDADIEVKTYWE